MRTVRVNTNGPATEGLATKLNCHMRDEQIDVRDGVAGDGQGLSEEGESRINEDAEDVNRGRLELVQVLEARAASQQQPQGPVVHWERFLPVRSLKVLLVENDDSTRHVVSALLRNCSYEVTAAANGLEAWKILEELPNHIDLVLTEVVMPYLSGIGLLSKIMNHKTCKNIPVIMMSSNDSMGIVFKCLSKGAVDFLVKPIRKNELKNLWQHVWRKCHSSSGSGSESGIRAQKSSKSKSVEGSANNTGSNDEDDIGSIGLNARDGSDNGSGTQNSWSKRPAEVESPQPMSPWDQTADPPDNTFALVIHSTPEAFSNNWVPTTAIRGCPEEDDEFDNFAMGKDLKIGVLRNSDLELENPNTRVSNGRTLDLDLKKGEKKFEKGKLELRPETPNGKLGNDAADLIAIITNNSNPQAESIPIEYPNEHSKIFHTKDMAQYDTKELPSLELSLKRLKQVGDSGTRSQERNVLRHSDLSAFSRYNTSTGNQAPTGNVGSCSPFDNSSEAAKTESMCNLHSNSKGTPKQRSNGSSNNNDMGSTTNNVVAKPEAFTNEPMPKTAVNVHPYVTFQPVQHSNSSVQPLAVDKADAAMVNSVLEQAKAKHPNVQVQHHHHHYHHHHHHVHNMQQQLPSHDDMSLRNMAAEAPHYGSSNALSVPNEGIATNYVSASGSNNGSNGQNDSGDAVIAEGENLASDYGVDGNDGLGLENGCGSRGGADQNRFAQREAALNKFRQKRKERCFEKKVRYQSRKKLAEQRPRVRGQFVRQTANENVSRDTNC